MGGGASPWRLGSSSWWAELEHDRRGLGCRWQARPVVQPFCMLGWRLEGLGISQPLLLSVGETEASKVVVQSFFNFENFISEYCIFIVVSPPFHLFLSQNLSR